MGQAYAGVAPVADKKPPAIEEQAIEAFKSFNQLYNWGTLNTVRKMRLLKIADNQYLALVNRYEDDQYPVIREIELFDNQVFFFIVFQNIIMACLMSLPVVILHFRT